MNNKSISSTHHVYKFSRNFATRSKQKSQRNNLPKSAQTNA